jgi:hypothetical protein
MRTIVKTGLALCFVGAMAIGTTAPVGAQGYEMNVPGIHAHSVRHRHYSDQRYYAYAPNGRIRPGTPANGITPAKAAPVSGTGATETPHK